MKVSEITDETVITFSRIDGDAPDRYLITELFLPAAKEYVRSHTALTEDEIDRHEDIPIAVCALCAFMYDNRSVDVASDKVSKVVTDILNKYDNNLIPRGDSA